MQGLTGGAATIDVVGGGKGALLVDVEVGVHGAIDCSGAVEASLGHLARGDVAAGKEVGEIGRSGRGEVSGHDGGHSSSRMRGTEKRC